MSSLRELVFYQSSQREYLDFGQNQLFCNSLICYAMHFYPSYLCNNYLHRIALDLSSINLLIMFPNFALCLSVTPFDLGDLPAVDLLNVFRWSDISLSNLLVNSSPLSDKIWVGAPKQGNPLLKYCPNYLFIAFWFYNGCCTTKLCSMNYH